MTDKKIVLLAGKGISSNIVFHAIDQQFGVHTAIVEHERNMVTFLRRRIKRLGIGVVVGQVLFRIVVVTTLELLSRRRIEDIVSTNALDTHSIPSDKSVSVGSINSDETIRLLKELQPDVIIVEGTRIISKRVLNSVKCKFINTHTGITPKYRGVHGTYWALVNNDKEHSGVTVHFVDEGIDTGNIIYQGLVTHTKSDNFVTYPFLQLSVGVKLLKQALRDYLDGTIKTQEGRGESHLWYHPTIGQYLYHRIAGGIK
jgi:methionyl-tRNA formyltransferase